MVVVSGTVGISRRHSVMASVHVHATPPDVAPLTLHDPDDDNTDSTVPVITSSSPAAGTAGMCITASFMKLTCIVDSIWWIV